MRVAALVALVVACGPGIPHQDQREVASNALIAASGDAAAIEKLLAGSVVDGGLWFADPTCAQFSGGGKIAPARFHELARCLATLHWVQSPRKDALADTEILSYPPGFEIEARVVQELSGPHLIWIGWEARRDNADALPTVTAQTLEALRTAGEHDGPIDPERAKTIELDVAPGSHGAFAWFKVCVDGAGAVTSAQPRETTSVAARDAFADAIAKWQFRPFAVGTGTLPACAMMRLAYPPGSGPTTETIPLPAPPSSHGSKQPIVFAPGVKTVEARRIQGRPFIQPDVGLRAEMSRKDIHRVHAAFRLCLDESGHPESILPMKSTGFADYDRELIGGMQAWVYSPFLVDGVPTPVCTEIQFVYTQD